MKKLLFTCIFCVGLTSTYAQEYPGRRAIREMYEGWIIVRLPAYDKKLNLLDSLMQLTTLSEKELSRIRKEYEETRRDSLHVYLLYPLAFDSLFTFTKFAFLKTSETQSFLAGKLKARTSEGEEVDIPEGDPIFFMNLPAFPTHPVKFTTTDHLDMSYPFPSKLGTLNAVYSGLTRIGTTTVNGNTVSARAKRVIERHVQKLNERLTSFLFKRGLARDK